MYSGWLSAPVRTKNSGLFGAGCHVADFTAAWPAAAFLAACPRLTFAPGLARLYVPLDRGLPGLPQEIGLGMYVYDSVESDGPSGPSLVHTWKAHSLVKFAGFSTDQKYLMFDIHETISDRTTKAPFGLFQAAFKM